MPMRAATWPRGTRVVWRDLTWAEFREIRSIQAPPAVRALEVYKICVISGPLPEEVPAGIMMWLAINELENSPFIGTFKSLSLPLEEARQKVNGTFLLSAQAFIASVLRISFKEMDEWDGETFLTRLAQAEFIAGVPLNPLDPNAPQDAKGKKVRKKSLTNAQQIALERRHEKPRTAAQIIDSGGKPSRTRESEVQTFSYHK